MISIELLDTDKSKTKFDIEIISDRRSESIARSDGSFKIPAKTAKTDSVVDSIKEENDVNMEPVNSVDEDTTQLNLMHTPIGESLDLNVLNSKNNEEKEDGEISDVPEDKDKFQDSYEKEEGEISLIEEVNLNDKDKSYKQQYRNVRNINESQNTDKKDASMKPNDLFTTTLNNNDNVCTDKNDQRMYDKNNEENYQKRDELMDNL